MIAKENGNSKANASLIPPEKTSPRPKSSGGDKSTWKEEHHDWKEKTCKGEVVHHKHVPQDRKGEIRLLREIFSKVDKNHDHELSVDEFGEVLNILDPTVWTADQIEKLFNAADENKNGSLDLKELVHFILGAQDHEGDSESDPEDYQYDSNEDYFSEDSEADDDELQMGAKMTRTATRKETLSKGKVKRPKRREEAATTVEEMYEILTMENGRMEGMLKLDDFVDLFMECRMYGLNQKLADLVPQDSLIEGVLPEELTALQIACLCQLVKENPEATIEDAKVKLEEGLALQRVGIAEPKCQGKAREQRHNEIKDAGIDLRLPLNLKQFKKLLQILGTVMQIDVMQMLSVLAWAKEARFEITDTLAASIIGRIFLKVPIEGRHLLDTPISDNDFARMCRLMGIIDNTEKFGIANGKVAILFGQILKNIPVYIVERDNKRIKHKGMKSKKTPGDRKHTRILGRSQMGILFEELYRAIPGSRGTYGSPLNMVLAFLEISDKQALERSLTMECKDNLMSPIHNVKRKPADDGEASMTMTMTKTKSIPKKNADTGIRDGWKN